MRHATSVALLLAGTMAVGLGCNNKDKSGGSSASASAKTTPAGQKTLWDRLGGEESVTKVVHAFVQRGAKNPKVNFVREGRPNQWEPTPENVKVLERRLVEFISVASGGPLKYTGKDMPAAHKGMEITSAEFDALANDLAITLDEFKVPDKEKNELLTAVGDTKEQIVGK